MANFRLLFNDADYSENYQPVLECFYNTRNQITIRIFNSVDTDDFMVMGLDKSTAIKFAKTLRTEINKIQNDEAN